MSKYEIRTLLSSYTQHKITMADTHIIESQSALNVSDIKSAIMTKYSINPSTIFNQTFLIDNVKQEDSTVLSSDCKIGYVIVVKDAQTV
jgi:hypothetical protein